MTSTEADDAPDWEQETIFVKPLKGGLESLEGGEYTIKRWSEAFLIIVLKLIITFEASAPFKLPPKYSIKLKHLL